MDRFGKQRIALRYWLLGAGYSQAAAALTLAECYHTGIRKDGRTPELAHQVAIALYLRTLHNHLDDPETTLTVALLHDVREDYDLVDSAIRNQFGVAVADSVEHLTKTFRGVDKPPEEVFAALQHDPIGSIVKGADRVHNQQSALGAFSTSKIDSYLAETKTWVRPMLKIARRNFNTQEMAYANALLMIDSQVQLLEAVVAS